jgi:hypothetical protein
MSVLEAIVSSLIAPGVREFIENADARSRLIAAINEIAQGIDCMALPDVFRTKTGTAKTLRSSGGTAVITLASLANGNGTSAGARQSATLDLGIGAIEFSRAQRYRLDVAFEMAATPTAGNPIHLYASWQDATGAGFGNTSGSDAAYTGYSNNIDAATKQLENLGSHICTAQATATVQKSLVGIICPKGRYVNFVVDNRSGAAFHSSDANCVITLTPIEDIIEDE